jgi:hypothetical protein
VVDAGIFGMSTHSRAGYAAIRSGASSAQSRCRRPDAGPLHQRKRQFSPSQPWSAATVDDQKAGLRRMSISIDVFGADGAQGCIFSRTRWIAWFEPSGTASSTAI